MLKSLLGGFGSSFIGGLFGSSSQNSANSTNIKLNQMNNDFQAAQMQKQMDYNTEMWRKQNAYNSPSAQVQRLKDAGLNPYMFMSGGNNTGVAQSANGVNLPSSSPAQVQPNTGISGMFGQMADYMMTYGQNKARIRKENAEAENQEIKNKYAAAREIVELDKMDSERMSNDAKRHLNDIETALKRSTYSSDVQQAQLMNDQTKTNIDLMKTQIDSFALDSELKRLNIKGWQQEFTSRLALMNAQISSLYAAGTLSLAQAEKARQDVVESVARTNGINIDNYQKNKINWILRETARNEMRRSANNIGADSPTQVFSQFGQGWLYKHGRDYFNKGMSFFRDVYSYTSPIRAFGRAYADHVKKSREDTYNRKKR